jgi:hypothetical protein
MKNQVSIEQVVPEVAIAASVAPRRRQPENGKTLSGDCQTLAARRVR